MGNSNRQISIRIGMEGGADVTRAIDDISRAGSDNFDRMAASWGKTGEAADKYKAQLQQIAAAAKEAALADEVNESWSRFLGVSDQVTNSARDAAQAFKEAEGGTTSWTNAIGLGSEALRTFGLGLSTAGVADWIKNVVESTGQIENQSRVLGISTDALQAYHAGAVLSGAGADVGDAAIRRFTRSLGDAQAGTKLQVDAFRQLGLSTDDLVGSTTEGLLPQVATALLGIADASVRARIETELFGRAGQDVELVLQRWADPDIIAHMQEAGLTIDRELVQRGAEADRVWSALLLKLKVGFTEFSLGGGALSLLTGIPTPTAAPSAAAATDPLAALAAKAIVQGPTAAGVPDSVDVTPLLPALYNAIETVNALNAFHDDVVKLLDQDEQARRIAEEYQAVLDRAGITNVPSNLAFGGRTALEAAAAGIGTGGVPIDITRPGLTGVNVAPVRDVLQGIGAESQAQFRPELEQGAIDNIVDKVQQEAQFAALLPQYRQAEQAILNTELKTHTAISDEQKQQIVNAYALAEQYKEIVQTELQMQSTFADWLYQVEQTGQLNFRKLFAGILQDWEKLLDKMIAEQAFQSLFGIGTPGAAGALGGAVGGILNSLDLAVGGPGLGGGGAGVLSDVIASVFHSGGIAGQPTQTRALSPFSFIDAPRFHSGGEVPALLLPGERVLNHAETAAYNAGGGATSVNINVSVQGANGDQHVVDLVNQGVQRGLGVFAQELPRRVFPVIDQARKDPRFRG